MLNRIAPLAGLALAASVLAAGAQAQTPPAQPPATAAPVERVTPPVVAPNAAEPTAKLPNPAPATTDAAKAPLEGANSFTEAQAKQRIVDAGYTDVSILAKDERGVWRGTAKKAGKSASVGVDFKGNVVQMN